MTDPPPIARRWRRLRALRRAAALALAWLLVAAIGTASFAPRGAFNDWAALGNALAFGPSAIAFGSSLAIAGAIAAVTSFAIAGRPRWAVEIAAAVGLAMVVLAAVATTCLWLAPGIARGRMGYWEFLDLRRTAFLWGALIVGYEVPLGAVLGLVAGSLSGLWAIQARRRPRVAMGLLLGLLFAGTFAPVQEFILGLVLFWGRVVRWWIWSPSMTDAFVPASGAT